MPTVSVVMPAYNAEKYIGQAFDSLIAQTFSDWECVVVNDGSTDGTLEIIERYAASDSRFRFATIKNSGSAKIPRDTAISMAGSEWIVTLDADDYLAVDVLESLIKRQQQTNADIVYLQMVPFDEQTKNPLGTIPASDFDFNQVMSGRDAMMATIGSWTIGANGALIKRELYLNLTTFQNPDICHMNADEYGTRELLSMARTVAFVHTIYHYRISSTSITHKITPKLFESVITDRMVAELVGRVFGTDSAEYRKAEVILLTSISGRYFMFTRYAKQLSSTDRAYVLELLKSERNRFTYTHIWHSQLPLVRKVLLSLPLWMTKIVATFYVRLKRQA